MQNHVNLPWVMRDSLRFLEKSLRENLVNNLVEDHEENGSGKVWKNYGGMMAFGPMSMVEPSAALGYHRVLVPNRGPIGARRNFM